MKRKIKFRAWIPALKIMLYNIAVYPDGMIGVGANELIKALPPKHNLIDDGIYHQDFENDNDIFEKIMSVLEGEDWVWFEEGQFELMQYTGRRDKNGNEIYQNDIIKIKDFICSEIEYDFPNDNPKETYEDLITSIYFMDGSFCFDIEKNIHSAIPISGFDEIEKIGNIYENPELINETTN